MDSRVIELTEDAIKKHTCSKYAYIYTQRKSGKYWIWFYTPSMYDKNKLIFNGADIYISEIKRVIPVGSKVKFKLGNLSSDINCAKMLDGIITENGLEFENEVQGSKSLDGLASFSSRVAIIDVIEQNPQNKLDSFLS